MTCGDAVELIPCLLLKSTEFDEAVAHHVGVGCKAFAHRLHGVASHAVVIFFLKVDDVEFAAVFLGDKGRYLDVLFGRAVHEVLFAFQPYFYVENMRLDALLLEERHYHRAIDAA